MNVATNEMAAVHAHLDEVYTMLPFTPAKGAGVWLEDATGRRVLDLYGGHAVAALGYGHPRLSDTIARAARDLVFQTNALPLQDSRRGGRRARGIRAARLRERVLRQQRRRGERERAERVALKVTGRAQVVAVERSFHGRTAAAARRDLGRASEVVRLPAHAVRRAVHPARGHRERCNAAVDSTTAAVIVEPVQGLAGAFDLATEFLRALRDALRRGRRAADFRRGADAASAAPASRSRAHLYGVMPDMLTTAKALGNGFPCAALLLPHEIARDLKPDSLGTTFGGGPMACAAIETVLEAIRDEKLLANVREVSAAIRSTCIVGPVVGVQGARLLARPADQAEGDRGARRAARARHPDRHERGSARPAAAAAVHPERGARDTLRDALEDLNDETLSRPRRLLARGDPRAARARGRGSTATPSRSALAGKMLSACCSSIRRCARWPRSRPAMSRLGGSVVRDHARAGRSWQLEIAPGRRDERRGGRACARGDPGARLVLRCARHSRVRGRHDLARDSPRPTSRR